MRARAAVLAAWAGAFCWLWLSGRGVLYLGPRTLWVLPVGTIGLAGAAVAAATSRRAGHGSGVAEILVVAVPLLSFVALADPRLGADAAARRAPGSAIPVAGDARDFRAIAYATRSPSYAAGAGIGDGAEVTLTGFVTRDADIPSGDFALTRFYVFCCTADAVPYFIGVDASGVGGSYSDDDWLRVTGRLRSSGGGLVLRADRIERVSEPDNPYLS